MEQILSFKALVINKKKEFRKSGQKGILLNNVATMRQNKISFGNLRNT